MIARSSTFPNHRHSSVSPSASASASSDPQADAAERLAQLADAQEAARGMRRLFLATLLFWAALYGWYLAA